MVRNNSPSVSPRKHGSRTFKARRALMACRRCRRLKKSCQQTNGERCDRCDQSDHDCVFVDVVHDPSAPRPPGSSSTVLVPNSPTTSPTEPLTPPSFVLYPSDPPDEIYSPPHVTHNNHLPFHPTHPMPNSNPQSVGLSIPSAYLFAQAPPLYPPDVFSPRQIDTTYPYFNNDGLYDDGPQVSSVQTPLPFTTNPQYSAEDMLDPPYPHRYLRSTPNPSLQTHNNFTIANSAPSSLTLHDTTPFLADFFPVASTSNLNHHLSMSTSQSLMSFEDSDFRLSRKLPCLVCSPGSDDCALHAPEYSYPWDSTEDEMQD